MEFALYWDTPGDSLMFEIFLLKVWKLFFFQNFIAFPLNTWNLMAICLLQKIGWWSKLLFGKCLQLTISILFRLVGFRVQGKCLFLSMCLVLGLLSLQIFCGKGVGLLFGSAANKAPKNGRKNPGGDWCTGKGNNWNFAKYVLDKYIGFFFRENPNLTTQQKPTHTHTQLCGWAWNRHAKYLQNLWKITWISDPKWGLLLDLIKKEHSARPWKSPAP